ncbi:MAG TPA: SAM-dependent methyltransferase [Thermoanaerobaculia bacterium]|nr:SAM-dependent methyltransferase [Thermoanaerobaculia bacterium]
MQNKDLSFRDFVEKALYDPSNGYYSALRDGRKRGTDYATSHLISPAFGFALAQLYREFLVRIGDGVYGIVDIGCGDGGLIRQIENFLALPELPQPLLFGVDRTLRDVNREETAVRFLEDFSAVPGDVPLLIISNELFDAFPFARLVNRGGSLSELWVTETAEGREWCERSAPQPYVDYLEEREIHLEEGQFADISLDWGPYYSALCKRVERAMIVTFDYGYESSKLFDPRVRRFGTAATYRRHQVGRELLAEPGQQDLTCHINFSDLIESGERAGLETLTFTRQARFLLSIGITGHPLFMPAGDVGPAEVESLAALADERDAARRLVLPAGIGDEMRVLVQSKNIPQSGWSFQQSLF